MNAHIIHITVHLNLIISIFHLHLPHKSNANNQTRTLSYVCTSQSN